MLDVVYNEIYADNKSFKVLKYQGELQKKKTNVEKKTQNVFNYEISVDLNYVIRYI